MKQYLISVFLLLIFYANAQYPTFHKISLDSSTLTSTALIRILEAKDSSIIMIGHSVLLNRQPTLLKMNNEGNIIWMKTYYNDLLTMYVKDIKMLGNNNLCSYSVAKIQTSIV